MSGLSVTPNVSSHGTATATFTVSNTGSRSGTAIVPVYVAQPVSSVVVPPQRLVGFTRVTLDAGQAKTVHVDFPVSTLAETQGDIDACGPPKVEPGAYVVQLKQERHHPVRRRRLRAVPDPLILDEGIAAPILARRFPRALRDDQHAAGARWRNAPGKNRTCARGLGTAGGSA
jgi:hypothetical protein